MRLKHGWIRFLSTSEQRQGEPSHRKERGLHFWVRGARAPAQSDPPERASACVLTSLERGRLQHGRDDVAVTLHLGDAAVLALEMAD